MYSNALRPARQDFFDAVVPLSAVDAVYVRVKE